MTLDRVVLLDEHTANRIAAGEVVERPASAVKELVENSLDAGARHIVVELEEGGKQRISVADDGSGMSRADAIMALQRHATSKIASADDLFSIRTLGFRGEALPSIASVSRFVMLTRPTAGEVGTLVRAEGGEMDVESAAASPGTTVEVHSLFYNTPARLKFLKATSTEAARAVEVVGCLAAAYPGVAIQLKNGNGTVFRTEGTGSTLDALAAVWGRPIARSLIPVAHESGGLRVSGYIGTPEITRAGRSHELFFVNQRPVKTRLLAHALEHALRELTPDARYPVAAIFIQIEPDMVDVNVHPAKSEVKFTRDGEVHHAVTEAIRQALAEYGIVPTLHAQTFVPAFEQRPAPSHNRTDTESSSSFASTVLGMAAAEMFPPPAEETSLFARPAADEITDPVPPRPFADQLRDFVVLGQARNTYIVALTADGLAIIDQHVAHERVLYERLTQKRFSDGIPVQLLATPLTLQLDRREALLLNEHCESFQAAGWDISPFGADSFIVRSVPAMLARKPYERILRDMIDELVNLTVSRRLLVQRDHVTITNACKMAVKAGDPLAKPEMEGLLEQLAETENPYLCPHGRPIVISIPFRDIDRLFKRS